MPNYKIRPLLRKDLPKLIELARAYWRFEKIPGFHPKLYRNLVTKIQKNPSQGRIWVAIEGDRPIGYLIAVYLMSFEYGGISTEIDEFYVKDSERGRGWESRYSRLSGKECGGRRWFKSACGLEN